MEKFFLGHWAVERNFNVLKIIYWKTPHPVISCHPDILITYINFRFSLECFFFEVWTFNLAMHVQGSGYLVSQFLYSSTNLFLNVSTLPYVFSTSWKWELMWMNSQICELRVFCICLLFLFLFLQLFVQTLLLARPTSMLTSTFSNKIKMNDKRLSWIKRKNSKWCLN